MEFKDIGGAARWWRRSTFWVMRLTRGMWSGKPRRWAAVGGVGLGIADEVAAVIVELPDELGSRANASAWRGWWGATFPEAVCAAEAGRPDSAETPAW